jgi:putative FmdB family regulatory protein
MPIYEYLCAACGEKEEHIQKVSDPPPPGCASCGGPLEKQMTAAAFHLKGGGWYADGYASPRPGAKAGSDAGSDSGDSPSTTSAANEAGGGGKAEKDATREPKTAIAS